MFLALYILKEYNVMSRLNYELLKLEFNEVATKY